MGSVSAPPLCLRCQHVQNFVGNLFHMALAPPEPQLVITSPLWCINCGGIWGIICYCPHAVHYFLGGCWVEWVTMLLIIVITTIISTTTKNNSSLWLGTIFANAISTQAQNVLGHFGLSRFGPKHFGSSSKGKICVVILIFFYSRAPTSIPCTAHKHHRVKYGTCGFTIFTWLQNWVRCLPLPQACERVSGWTGILAHAPPN